MFDATVEKKYPKFHYHVTILFGGARKSTIKMVVADINYCEVMCCELTWAVVGPLVINELP